MGMRSLPVTFEPKPGDVVAVKRNVNAIGTHIHFDVPPRRTWNIPDKSEVAPWRTAAQIEALERIAEAGEALIRDKWDSAALRHALAAYRALEEAEIRRSSRIARGVSLRKEAENLGITPQELSKLEHP